MSPDGRYTYTGSVATNSDGTNTIKGKIGIEIEKGKWIKERGPRAIEDVVGSVKGKRVA